MMQLYYTPGSPFARVARVLALELQLDCELIEDSGFPPQQAGELNPALQVPFLVAGSLRLFGTRLIADYLLEAGAKSEQRGAPPLALGSVRPEARWRDAQILTGLEQLLTSLVTRSYLIWTRAEHQPGAAIPMDMAERELTRVLSLLDWLEDKAGDSGFLAGCLSLQDIWLIASLEWCDARIPVPWRGRPRLEAIVDGNSERPSLAATRPQPWQPTT